MKEPAPLSGRGDAARRSRRWTAARLFFACSAACIALLVAAPLHAQESDSPTDLFGARGVIGTPSARMAPDGELSVGASFLRNNQHYNFGFEVLPWLEASFRYSGLQHFLPEYPVYYDRAFGVKARLFQEDGALPAVAIGIDDLIGTGVYSGEYLVLSKQIGDFDTSLGMGWGRLAGAGLFNNPIGLVFPSFNNRKSFFGEAGQEDSAAFFHGKKVGLFGGTVWHTPVDGLSLMVEYDSDNYAQEKSLGNFDPRSQVNYGLSYQLGDQAVLGLDWLYGTTIGGSVSLRLDPVHPQYPQTIEPPPPPVVVRDEKEQQQALQNLLLMRDPNFVRREDIARTRSADRNAFVDALWQQSGDYADIQVRSTTLDLAVTGSVSSLRCASVARLMQGLSTNIARIALHDPAGHRGVVCAVPRSVEARTVSAALLSADNLQVMALPVVQTIDAASALPPLDRVGASRAIRKALAAQHIQVDALKIGDGELILYYRNGHYFSEVRAIDRIIRVLTAEAPPQVEKFRLIAMTGMPVRKFDVLRGPVERSYQQNDGDIFENSVKISDAPMDNPVLAEASSALFPRFSWSIAPQFRQALFDPSEPFGVQFLAVASATLEVAQGLSLNGSLEASLYDNFNTARQSNSVLPHVRSDFIKYFTEGKTGIGNLEADYRFRLAPNVYGILRGGYLESMFSGGGGEILWRPQNARWALGVDVYQVWQRDFDRLFGLQSYHQTTGHISLYYDSPWYDLDFELRAGQYLAGDRGVTFQVTRRFSTGVEIGAFLTKTNVSAADFGEGSFDKGIIIRIPVGWVAPIETQSTLTMNLRPVQRDGGQTLGGDATLYEETRASSNGELIRDGFANPW